MNPEITAVILRKKTRRSRIRTGDKRICNPLDENANASNDNALSSEGEGRAQLAHKTDPISAPSDAIADERLKAMMKAWATLPEALRAGIAAMVKASGEG